MTKQELKLRIFDAIDRRADDIIAIGERIRRHPELGFKEYKTAAVVKETFRMVGLVPTAGLARTGVRAVLEGRAGSGPGFGLLGELDALVVEGHPEADPDTGAAHACGHNAQVAGLLGAVMGLLEADAAEQLAGRVIFFAVPAEEYGDLEWRFGEVEAGRLEFMGGKPELLRLGHLNDVDLAMMIHTTPRPEEGKAGVPDLSNNGCVVKTIRYVGRAAHAGSLPHRGVNALYAAQLALAAINALRETFQDQDSIRIHPIITRGGSQVNVIPADVRLETFVRGKTIEAILDADAKVNRALRAGALALGATVEIRTAPGYMPMTCNTAMAGCFRANAVQLFGEEHYRPIVRRTGSTDMGDLSQIMPVLHPYMGGAKGTNHGADYAIVDKPLAYVAPAKALAAMVVDMLADGAAGAAEILRQAKPPMTRDKYLALQRGINRRETWRE
jgi:amidohydrolase